jgi:hypothetical protein
VRPCLRDQWDCLRGLVSGLALPRQAHNLRPKLKPRRAGVCATASQAGFFYGQISCPWAFFSPLSPKYSGDQAPPPPSGAGFGGVTRADYAASEGVIVGIILAILLGHWWIGLIIALVGLVFFGGFAKGKWY